MGYSLDKWEADTFVPAARNAAHSPPSVPEPESLTVAQPAGVGFAASGADTGTGAFGTITQATM